MAAEVLEVEARLKDFISQNIDNINNNMKELQKTTQKSNDNQVKFANTLKNVAKAATGLLVFKKVIDIGNRFVSLADKQIKAETALGQALGKTSNMLLEQAAALQKTTLFGDEATIQAQALVAQFVDSEQTIARLTPLIQDFATAQGVDLNTAAKLVTKTIASGTNALSRYGIEVEGTAGSSERLEMLTAGLTNAFGGAAEAAASAGAGPLTQMKNALGDIGETIGAAILPAVNAFAKTIVNNTGIITRSIDFIRGAFNLVASGINTSIEFILKGIKLLAEGLNGVLRFFGKAEIDLTTLNLSIQEFNQSAQQSADSAWEAFTGEKFINQGIENIKTFKKVAAEPIKTAEKAKEEKLPAGFIAEGADPTKMVDMAAQVASADYQITQETEQAKRDEIQKTAEARRDAAMSTISAASQMLGQIQGMLQQERQQEFETARARINAMNISQEAKDKMLKEAEKKNKQQAKKEKGIAIAQAVINTALAVSKALSQGGFPAGIAFAAILGAMGAIQIATIAKQKFAKGGSFITNGQQNMGGAVVGDNPGGRELVTVTPLSSRNFNGPGMGGDISVGDTNITITGQVTQRDIDQIDNITRRRNKQLEMMFRNTNIRTRLQLT